MTHYTQKLRGWIPLMTCCHMLVCSVAQLFGQTAASNLGGLDFPALKARYEEALEASTRPSQEAKNVLKLQYAEFLSKLEQRLQASGKLDRLINVKQEKKLVQLSGSTTTQEDPEMSKARATYLARLKDLESDRRAKFEKIQQVYFKHLESLEVNLTKEGSLAEALEVKKEREALVLGRSHASEAQRPSIPEVNAPEVASNFLETKMIQQSFTLPVGKFQLSERIEVKRPSNIENAVQIKLSEGTEFQGSNRGEFFLGAGTLVGKEIRAESVKWSGDLNSNFYFKQSVFKSCTFTKTGPWGGPKHASRWHFEDCVFEGDFMPQLIVKKVGLRMLGCVVKGVVLPSVDFEDGPVAQVAGSDWFQVQNTVFENCEVPVTFLLLTKGCKFVDCTFVDASVRVVVDAPMTVEFHEVECIWKTRDEMNQVQFARLDHNR